MTASNYGTFKDYCWLTMLNAFPSCWIVPMTPTCVSAKQNSSEMAARCKWGESKYKAEVLKEDIASGCWSAVATVMGAEGRSNVDTSWEVGMSPQNDGGESTKTHSLKKDWQNTHC